MNKELLLEIGTEEIPAPYIPPALSQLEMNVKEALIQSGAHLTQTKTLGTPRRLALVVKNLEIKKGGGPGLAALLAKAITSLSFPKSMRWGSGALRFARPIRWLLTLYNGQVLPLKLGGIKADKFSYGHRFLKPEKFEVKSSEQWQEELKKRFVVVDPKERKSIIRKQIEGEAKRVGGQIPSDETLLETVNWLVEYPVALLGNFKEEFLTLPNEVLIMVMRHHQKYFPLVDKSSKLLPNFITIANIKVPNPRQIIEGNERVITARFADAEFLFAADKKIPLEKMSGQLRNITFQEKLGTMEAKARRLSELAEFLAMSMAPKLKKEASRAALLAKADLVSGMVGEFPELQGIMGGYYAKNSGENREVSGAIFEHYLPRFADDELPKTQTGTIVSLADKIDNLVGYFGLGLTPSGAEDPYALRRQALGIIRIIWGNSFKLSLEKLIAKSLFIYRKFNKNKVKKELLKFLTGRLENFLQSKKFPTPIIQGVMSLGFDDLTLVRQRIDALNSLRAEPKFKDFQAAMKRVNNILGKVEKRTLKVNLLKEPAEKELYKIFLTSQKKVRKGIKKDNYKEALTELTKLAPAIHQFFDKVLVMDKNMKIRASRLALLSQIYASSRSFAAFEKVR